MHPLPPHQDSTSPLHAGRHAAALALAVCVLALGGCAAPGGGAGGAAAMPVDANVTQALAAVSAQRIEARVRTLAGFGTRHTLSETVSDTRGIGAARRWIKRELETCSGAAGGRMQVAFEEHLEPVGPRVPQPTPIVNVVATLPGTDAQSRDRLYVVSGHYDSMPGDVLDAQSDAPGANDDASGVAAVMEMACVMAGHRFDATLVFIAFAGEEQGLLGAARWAAEARRKGLRVEAMVTNDIVGSPVGDFGQRDARQLRLFADGLTPLLRLALRAPGARATAEDAQAFEEVRQRLEAQTRAGGTADLPTNQLGRHLKEAGERYLPGFQVNLVQRPDRYLRGGDHLPFLARGYAAVRFTEPFENFRHQHQNVRVENGVQYGDLPEFVDPAYVADVARINIAGLATLALAPAPPANVRIEVLQLGNDTTLRWDRNAEPDLAGYRVVWRETGSPVWQHRRDVGNVTQAVLPGLSKDNVVFGVQAVDRAGHASMASFPLPVTR